jgi:hypothetical protein
VRRVATFFRAPWCSSIWMTSFLGCEKLTAKWLRFLVSLPVQYSVRIYSSLYISLIYCVPRGPSTVTSLDLMVTLTVGEKLVSNCSSTNAPGRDASRCTFCLALLPVLPGLGKTNRTHLPRGRSRSRMNECTSFWTFRVVGMAGRRRKISRSTSTFKITNFECAVHSLRICQARDIPSELVLSRMHFQEAEFQNTTCFSCVEL